MEILGTSLFGGLLSLDATAVGQFMVSRPLVAGLLTGWVLGDPSLGGVIGAVLELYLLVSFPTGGSRFPEGSTATVVAVAVAAPYGETGALPLALAVGLVWGQLGGATVTLQRRINARLVPDPRTRHVTGARVVLAHLGAIGSDLVRGSLVTLVGIVLGRMVIGPLEARWPIGESESIGLLLVGGSVSAGILLNDLGGFRKRRAWLALGLALGIVGMRFL